MKLQNRGIFAVVALILALIAKAEVLDADQPSRRPTITQMRASIMPTYKADSGVVEECLGRLVWSAEKKLSGPYVTTVNRSIIRLVRMYFPVVTKFALATHVLLSTNWSRT